MIGALETKKVCWCWPPFRALRPFFSASASIKRTRTARIGGEETAVHRRGDASAKKQPQSDDRRSASPQAIELVEVAASLSLEARALSLALFARFSILIAVPRRERPRARLAWLAFPASSREARRGGPSKAKSRERDEKIRN